MAVHVRVVDVDGRLLHDVCRPRAQLQLRHVRLRQRHDNDGTQDDRASW